MSITINKEAIAALVSERALIFQHDIVVGWYVMISFVVVLVTVSLLTAWRRRNSNESSVPEWALVFAVGTVIIWALWRADTYFEQKQFERTPQTYAIKHLR